MLVVAPLAHQAHNARFGADHVHDAAGTRALPVAHEAFHVDLAALRLDEVASAGTLTVDCSLAELTLVDCGEAALAHAPNFGDLLAHPHAPPPDPTHGKDAAEHGAVLLVAAAAITLPPPPVPHAAPPFVVAPAPRAGIDVLAPSARGPPLAA